MLSFDLEDKYFVPFYFQDNEGVIINLTQHAFMQSFQTFPQKL